MRPARARQPVLAAPSDPGAAEPPSPSRLARRFAYATNKPMSVTLTGAMRDHAVERLDDIVLDPWIEEVVMLGHPCHYKVRTREPYAVGEMEFCALADGLLIYLIDVDFCGPWMMSVSAPDMMRVRIASESDAEYAPPRGESLTVSGPGASLIIEPAGQAPADAAFAGPNRAIQLYVHRDTLKQLYAGGETELPAALQAFVDGGMQATVVRRLPLGAGLLRCLEDLHGCRLAGHSRRLFLRSKAVEMLCHAFAAMDEEDRDGASALSAATTRGVMRAQRLLVDNFVSPPSLDDLAQAVGMSRSSLCAGFRQVLGQSVFDYIQDLRMQRALALLAQRDASITQIAYAVGYNYPSSFSVAVQRRFGATPRELRRRGALPSL